MFTIIISEKGGAERRETFDKNEINVGRVQGNDLMLPKGNVSKHHARLLYRDARFIVTDLKSTNGTYVNGRKISQATIVREGDKIYVGDFVLRLETGQKAAGHAEEEGLRGTPLPPRSAFIARDGASLSSSPPLRNILGSSSAPPMSAPPQSAGPAAAIAHSPSSSPRLSEPGVSHYPLERDPDSESSMDLRASGAKISTAPRAPLPTEPRARNSSMLLASEQPQSQRPPVLPNAPPANIARVLSPRAIARETPQQAGHRLALITLVDRVADTVDVAALTRSLVVGDEAAQSIERAVRQQASAMREEGEVPNGVDLELLGREALREFVGLGAVGPLIEDDATSEIHVLRPDCVLTTKDKVTTVADASFTSDEALGRVVARLAQQSGHPLQPGEELIERRLPRGAIMTAIAPPAASGWVLHIGKRRRVETTLTDLVRQGAMSEAIASLLESAAALRANVLAVGSSPGAVSLLLAAIAAAAPAGERVIVLQRGADELVLPRAHAVSLRLAEDGARAGESVHAAARLGLDRLIVTLLGGAVTSATVDVIAEGSQGVLAGMAAPSLRHALARLASQVAIAHPGSSADAAAQAVGNSFDIAVDLQSGEGGRLRAVRVAELHGASDGGVVARDLFVLSGNEKGEYGYAATGLAPRLSIDYAARKQRE